MQVILIPLIILVIWKPFWGSIIYLVMYGMMIIWITQAGKYSQIKVNNKNNKWTDQEVKVIEKYNLFFQYPVACRILSTLFSGFQLAVFLLTPYLIYRGLWIPAIIIGVSYFISPQFSVTLNPQFFLHDNLDKGKFKEGHEFYKKYKSEME